MALPDYAFYEAGTVIEYTSAGGTKAMNMAGLPNGSGYQGVKSDTLVDVTKGMPAFLDILLTITPSGAPTDGATIDLFISESASAIASGENPGGLSGTDSIVGIPNDRKRQLKYAGSLILSSTLGATPQTQRLPRYNITTPYFCPMISNSGGINLSNVGTNHHIYFTPYYRKLAD